MGTLNCIDFTAFQDQFLIFICAIIEHLHTIIERNKGFPLVSLGSY